MKWLTFVDGRFCATEQNNVKPLSRCAVNVAMNVANEFLLESQKWLSCDLKTVTNQKKNKLHAN